MRVLAIVFSLIFGMSPCSSRAYAQSVLTPWPRHVCVLNFERPEHPMSQVVDQLFANLPSVEVHQMAAPADLLTCIEHHSTEIMLLAHALLTPAAIQSGGPVNLAYFQSLSGEERDENRRQFQSRMGLQLIELSKRYYNPASNETQKRKIALDYQALKEKSDELANLPATEPYYVLTTFLPQVMRRARAELKLQANEPRGLALQKIRLMSCVPQEVLAKYDDLRALVKEDRIVLDIAPVNGFLSFFEGEQVTSVNPDWMSKSLLPSEIQRKN